MKTRVLACVLALGAATSGRGADVAKEVHDAVRDLLDLKRYAWRVSYEIGSGSRSKPMPVAAGRTEVDGPTIAVLQSRGRKEMSFVQLGGHTVVNEEGWKLLETMTADELRAVGWSVPRARETGAVPHLNFIPPHDVLVAIVGVAPAPDWIGDRIVGVFPVVDADLLQSALLGQDRLDWEPIPKLVRNKLGAPVPVAPRPTILRPDRRAEITQQIYKFVDARYELWLREGVIEKLVLRFEAEGGTRYAWIFEFSEVGRVDVTPDTAAKTLLTP